MIRSFVLATGAFLCFATLPSFCAAQEDETYDFDGVADMDPQPEDPTDWMTSVNWNDGGADPLPPFGPEIPDFGTRVEIETSTFGVDAPEIGPGDMAQAFGVRIGRFGGEGLLTMSGGTLETVDSCGALPFSCNRRIRVGAAQSADPASRNPGTFNLSDGTVTTDTLWIGSGSLGEMNMSGGSVTTRGDLSLDWSFDSGSVLNMTGGTINVATSPFASITSQALRMYRNSTLNLDGGEILINGRAELGVESIDDSAGGVQTPDVTVSIASGLMEATDALIVNGTVTIDGGILRADSFNESNNSGTLEINSSGLLQFNSAQEDVAAVEGLISAGVITTGGSEPLVVGTVDLDGTEFTQVSVASAGIAGDFDGDQDVDGADFSLWQQGFPSMYDANDLADWQNGYGSQLTAVHAVPEPSSFAAMAGSIALLGGMRRLRR